MLARHTQEFESVQAQTKAEKAEMVELHKSEIEELSHSYEGLERVWLYVYHVYKLTITRGSINSVLVYS